MSCSFGNSPCFLVIVISSDFNPKFLSKPHRESKFLDPFDIRDMPFLLRQYQCLRQIYRLFIEIFFCEHLSTSYLTVKSYYVGGELSRDKIGFENENSWQLRQEFGRMWL